MKQEKTQKQQVQPTKKNEESLSYSVEVRDKEGRVIHRVSAPSRSYVEQWNQIVNSLAKHGYCMVRDTAGVENNIYATTIFLSTKAGAGEVRYGIRVGKGTTPVAIDDYALETPCDEGAGLDEFNHQVVTYTEPSVVGSTCSFTVQRVMVNNSGATININEIGTYVRSFRTPDHFYYNLGFRDVLPSSVTVPTGGSITVTYTIAATV